MRAARRRPRYVVGAVVGVLLSGLLAACGGDGTTGDENRYRVGVLAALTGPAATIGQAEADAAEAVVETINNSGGINGREIELIVKDTRSDPTEAARLTPDLIRSEDVIAIFGATTSSGLLAELPIAARSGTPVIAPGSAAAVTDPSKPWHSVVFQVAPTSANDNAAVGAHMQQHGISSVGVLYQDDAANSSTAELFAQQPPDGVQIVDKVALPSDATDTSVQASRIASADPDAVYVIASSLNLTASVARSLVDLGYDGQLYANAGAAQTALLDTAGEAIEGMVAAALINPSDPSATPKLAELLESAGGIRGYGSLLGANGMATIAAGLESDPKNGDELAQALLEASPIEGYGIAPLEFTDEDRQGFSDEGMFTVRVENGKFVTTG